MNNDLYMLVCHGTVQRIEGTRDGQPAKIWPVAETYEDAAKLARWTNKDGVRATRIGSFPGETLQDHIDMALREGCVASCCVSGWNDDGSPRWKWILFDKQEK